MFVIDEDAEVYEFDLSCNWSIIDGACDDPITTSDEGKDILSLIESLKLQQQNKLLFKQVPQFLTVCIG